MEYHQVGNTVEIRKEEDDSWETKKRKKKAEERVHETHETTAFITSGKRGCFCEETKNKVLLLLQVLLASHHSHFMNLSLRQTANNLK